ncbi:hypothetical protein SAMN05216571_101419 [Onishia taeanensis]|uniref:Uncharacterized protein n=1 Tax=Onishia taeanensis TaxID=284577 RepID=A0A1G7NFU2_9GAMM|nr:hypothetical protein [Halomonas taeanensis]SDF72924.1 hypothetical protein SAMN05216571_101419 [Halomonas taeanensis]
MSKNLRMIVDNLHDTATLTATSEALAVENTQRTGRAYPWRSTDLAEQVITATLPTPNFIDALVLYRHNLSSTSTVRLELLNAGEVVYDTGAVTVSGLIPLGDFRFGVDPWGATLTRDLPIKQAPFWFPATAITGYRLTFNDPDNLDGVMEVGRIITGQVVSPQFNASYGVELEWKEAAEHIRSEGGSLRTLGGGIARRLSFNLDFMDARGRATLTRAFLRGGKGRDIYVSLYPEAGGLEEAEHAFVGRREGNYGHQHNFYANWRSSYTLVEV